MQESTSDGGEVEGNGVCRQLQTSKHVAVTVGAAATTVKLIPK